MKKLFTLLIGSQIFKNVSGVGNKLALRIINELKEN